MKQFKKFVFKNYLFDPKNKKLELNYGFDDKLSFTETYKFDFSFDPKADPQLLEVAFQTLFYMAGVSYFKTYLPSEIELSSNAPLDQESAAFFSKTYEQGLGEFFYVNQLDPQTPIKFPYNSPPLKAVSSTFREGLLVGIGGGKDSLVSVELLRDQPKLATWSVGHHLQLEPLVSRIGLPHLWVERQWDKKLLTHNQEGAYNGHIPITAILSCVGLIVAILGGYKDVVMSNENSANEPTLNYQGTDINHQYSKSIEFERDFQELLAHRFGDSLRYYSLLRPFSELRIAEIFSKSGFAKYKDVFSSCNRAFVHSSHSLFWCGRCPKCAFIFLAFTPFLPREEVEKLFHGKNLLLDPTLEPTYRQLLGIEGDKPLECVGEIKESRSAMKLAQKIYPELKKYRFDLPTSYDFRAPAPHLIPEDIFKILAAGSLL